MNVSVALPPAVWSWMDQQIPSVAHVVHPVAGGFTDGVRGVMEGRTRRAFVKARELNGGDRDEMLEAAVLRLLPASVGAPALIGAVELDGWFVTLTEYVDGRTPTEPWSGDELSAVLAHTDRMVSTLTRVTPPADTPTVVGRMRGRSSTWRRLVNDGKADHVTRASLTPWEREHLEELAALECRFESWSGEGQLLHFDLRYDNILLSSDGVRVLDWGRASIGPGWVDPVCLLLESEVADPDLDGLFLRTRSGQRASAEDVDAFLAILASYWRDSSEDPTAPPLLTARRRRSLQATETWLAARWEPVA